MGMGRSIGRSLWAFVCNKSGGGVRVGTIFGAWSSAWVVVGNYDYVRGDQSMLQSQSKYSIKVMFTLTLGTIDSVQNAA